MRKGLWRLLRRHGQPNRVSWRGETGGGNVIVAVDLHVCHRWYRSDGPAAWEAAIRRTGPGILALARTERDRRCAVDVADLVSRSSNRIVVCANPEIETRLDTDLARTIARIEPDSIVSVGLSDLDRRLWFTFGDGRTATLDWSLLKLDEARPAVLSECPSIDEDLKSLRFRRRNGDPFDVDAAAIRSLVDRAYARRRRAAVGEISADIGQKLRAHRQRRGLTQMELAGLSGLDQALISRMEHGRHQPRFTTLSKYARGLKTTLGDLLDDP